MEGKEYIQNLNGCLKTQNVILYDVNYCEKLSVLVLKIQYLAFI